MTKELISEIELLEEEVANREQHVLSLYKSIFEQCISRAPSELNSVVASTSQKEASRNENKKKNWNKNKNNGWIGGTIRVCPEQGMWMS
ncbi:hypothetical protein C1H46_013564 [Malus baccata]|uniref:Ternary complex factor MIP1 leucine-zipper domain-containing protein n=1 Tax=Malus baccata TaxID=106549 RepID=A0A540L8Y6_MALBA|nr:hypothetical protein C1H46_031519 [Malus baccata]TQE00769.1 hypothetical protein C1H46_013564 [Malus baccata]